MYDIIGDIHGYAEALKELLHKMEYKEVNGVWQHYNRKVIFVGDYIDRGPAIRETLNIVRTMNEKSNAIALMGNHEYNALAYAYRLSDGSFLRTHNEKNNKQHEATLKEFDSYPEEWKSYLDWFYSLQLFLDLPQLRAVHACWDEEHINWLKERNYTTLNEKLLLNSHLENDKAYEVITDTLKGKEFLIPEEYAWKDKDGHLRTENRWKWWIDPKQFSYDKFLFDCPKELKDKMIDEKINAAIYPEDAVPVFFGHYWLEDPYPVIQASNVICLDYSIAKKGNLVAYRWSGEEKINNTHFVSVKYKEE